VAQRRRRCSQPCPCAESCPGRSRPPRRCGREPRPARSPTGRSGRSTQRWRGDHRRGLGPQPDAHNNHKGSASGASATPARPALRPEHGRSAHRYSDQRPNLPAAPYPWGSLSGASEERCVSAGWTSPLSPAPCGAFMTGRHRALHLDSGPRCPQNHPEPLPWQAPPR